MTLPFEIGGEQIPPGSRQLIDLPVAKLSNHTPISLPVHVIHGRNPGPSLFVSAVIHGDEVIGVEIIHRLLRTEGLENLFGTLLCVPIVNAFGFISHTRYLPDRRDLNRSFPGRANGPLAAQLAHIFMQEVVLRSDVGIDLHSAADGRTNLPQIRNHFATERSLKLAKAFGAPIILKSDLRPGSLRESAQEHGVDVLIFEAGEALRLDEFSVRAGVLGILRVMKALNMIDVVDITVGVKDSAFSRSSKWVRAEESGLLRTYKTIGDSVEKDEPLATITNPYEDAIIKVNATKKGLIIGRTNLAVVNCGDALFHIAKLDKPDTAEQRVTDITDELDSDPIFDEDEII